MITINCSDLQQMKNEMFMAIRAIPGISKLPEDMVNEYVQYVRFSYDIGSDGVPKIVGYEEPESFFYPIEKLGSIYLGSNMPNRVWCDELLDSMEMVFGLRYHSRPGRDVTAEMKLIFFEEEVSKSVYRFLDYHVLVHQGVAHMPGKDSISKEIERCIQNKEIPRYCRYLGRYSTCEDGMSAEEIVKKTIEFWKRMKYIVSKEQCPKAYVE